MFASKTPRYSRHVQHNEPSPILVEFREEAEDLGESYPKDWLRICNRHWWNPDAVSDAQIDHARKVLTRLAALS